VWEISFFPWLRLVASATLFLVFLRGIGPRPSQMVLRCFSLYLFSFPSMLQPSLNLQPTEFNKDSAAWTDAVSQGNSLLSNFTNGSLPPVSPPVELRKLQYVVFSVTDMVALISTPGTRYIRAQFVLLPAQFGTVRFTVALFALDSQRGRISAYYAGGVTEGSMNPTPPAANSGGTGALPVDLVQTWIKGWQDATDVTYDMFSTNYGPLQGYIFELNDFIDPLFPVGVTTNHELRVYFGLHSYQITSANETQSASTMGLILSVQKTEDTKLPFTYHRNTVRLLDNNGTSPTDGSDGFYDLSHPNPPGAPPASS